MRALTVLIVLLSCASPALADDFVPVDGDIVFHESTSAQSEVIALVTGSRYTHMGVVVVVEGEPMVFEAAATVRLTPWRKWVGRGVDDHVVVKRLAAGPPSADQLALMQQAGESLRGRDYDNRFLWDDDAIYCSELVWKLYAAAEIELVALQTYRDFDLTDPRAAELVAERFGDEAVPLDEPVVSPVSILDSPRLETVFEAR